MLIINNKLGFDKFLTKLSIRTYRWRFISDLLQKTFDGLYGHFVRFIFRYVMMEGAGIEHQKERQSDSAHEDAVDQFTIAHPTKLEMFMVYVTFLTEKCVT